MVARSKPQSAFFSPSIHKVSVTRAIQPDLPDFIIMANRQFNEVFYVFMFTTAISAKEPGANLSHTVSRPSKQRIARSFGLKAATYDANAVMQAKIIKWLVPEITRNAQKNDVWIDLGCGIGLVEKQITASPRRPFFIGLDIALEPLLILQRKTAASAVQGDIEALPFTGRPFDGAVVASVLQWIEHPAEVLQKIASLLRPGAPLIFSIFTQGSFTELMEINSSLGRAIPVNCPLPEQLAEMFSLSGLADITYETVKDTHYFTDARTLIRSISRTGGSATAERPLSKNELALFCDSYDSAFRNNRGVPLTYCAMMGICRKAGKKNG